MWPNNCSRASRFSTYQARTSTCADAHGQRMTEDAFSLQTGGPVLEQPHWICRKVHFVLQEPAVSDLPKIASHSHQMQGLYNSFAQRIIPPKMRCEALQEAQQQFVWH